MRTVVVLVCTVALMWLGKNDLALWVAIVGVCVWAWNVREPRRYECKLGQGVHPKMEAHQGAGDAAGWGYVQGAYTGGVHGGGHLRAPHARPGCEW